jgi:hypothetical protein
VALTTVLVCDAVTPSGTNCFSSSLISVTSTGKIQMTSVTWNAMTLSQTLFSLPSIAAILSLSLSLSLPPTSLP